jgi:hypothetical protein
LDGTDVTASLTIDLTDPATRDARLERWLYLAGMGIVPEHRVRHAWNRALADDFAEPDCYDEDGELR